MPVVARYLDISNMEHLRLWAPLCLIVTLVVTKSLYRLYFHPLSRFPGPRLAAVTHLYEFYHDVVRNGMFLWKIQEMHEKYGETASMVSRHSLTRSSGPIVRINPREIHIRDPYFHDHIYASGGRKRTKDPHFVPLFAAPLSMITTIDHDHHRFRRGILSSFFSKRSVVNMTPLIQEKVSILMERFDQASHDGTVMDLTAAFCALTGDIIAHYTYGQSADCLRDRDFKNDISGGILELESANHLNRFVPLLVPLMQLVPSGLAAYLKPATASILAQVTNQSKDALMQSNKRDQEKDQEHGRQTLVEALSSPKLPAGERTLPRLQQEGMILLSGGTESPANALSVAAFHLSNNPSTHGKLREEVQPVTHTAGQSLTLAQLEQLPYLVRHLFDIEVDGLSNVSDTFPSTDWGSQRGPSVVIWFDLSSATDCTRGDVDVWRIRYSSWSKQYP